jgi:hypothetical protein
VRHFYFDSETRLFAPGYMAPKIVCLQYCHDEGAPTLLHARADRTRMLGVVRDSLKDSNTRLVGHNVAYDLACLAAEDEDLIPLIFDAYADNRVTDTMFRQKLADISRGRYRTRQYNLEDCADIHDFPDHVDKADPWRVRYGELEAVALHYWPESAKRYALRDATATRHVHKSQARRYDPAWYCDEFNQARKFWCLRLMEVWGIRTDERGVADLARGAQEEIEDVRETLEMFGLVRPDGSRALNEVRARVVRAYAAIGKPCPMTDPSTKNPMGLPKADNDACEQSDDFVLRLYSKYSQMSKVLSSDVPMLANGLIHPIHTHFDLVESGRTSSASPNIQNPRRLAGVRECFVPRDGNVFIDADMSALELRTVAQVCLKIVGFSKLAEVLNAGRDPHTALAATMLGKSYEWVEDHIYEVEVGETRTAAKGMNFGFPGGLGAASFPAFAWKAYKVKITEDEVKQRKEEWLAAFPEFRPYHRFIGETYEDGVRHLFTNRLRGRVTFTAAANSYFQGLGADVCGGALFEVSRACYCDRRSVLFGSRPVNFMHDSILTETHPSNTNDALAEQMRLMIAGGAPFLPDVPPKVDGKAMTRWSKDAALITHNGKKTKDGGRVVPWAPLARGESLDAYAARVRVPTDALKKTFEAQEKAFRKADEKRSALKKAAA